MSRLPKVFGRRRKYIYLYKGGGRGRGARLIFPIGDGCSLNGDGVSSERYIRDGGRGQEVDFNVMSKAQGHL